MHLPSGFEPASPNNKLARQIQLRFPIGDATPHPVGECIFWETLKKII